MPVCYAAVRLGHGRGDYLRVNLRAGACGVAFTAKHRQQTTAHSSQVLYACAVICAWLPCPPLTCLPACVDTPPQAPGEASRRLQV